MAHRRFLIQLFLLLALAAHAQSPVSTLNFLAGRWTTQTPDDFQEETWSPPIGGSVTGMFRVVHSGRAVFFELWSVEERDGKAVMLLKHFNAGLKGWEEKDASTELPLVKTGPAMAEFSDGKVILHYDRAGDTLNAKVTHIHEGKPPDIEEFHLTRAIP